VGFVVNKVVLEQVFSANSDSPNTPYSSSGAGTIGQLVADVKNGLSYPTPRKLKRNAATTFHGQIIVIQFNSFI
jgi:hypothetical protein